MTDRSGFDEAVDATVRAVRFVTSSGTDLERALPTDRYPDGAAVRPIGWADASLLVAQVGSDVALLTSSDRAESEWTWRTLVEDVPESESVSIAVDLVPTSPVIRTRSSRTTFPPTTPSSRRASGGRSCRSSCPPASSCCSVSPP